LICFWCDEQISSIVYFCVFTRSILDNNAIQLHLRKTLNKSAKMVCYLSNGDQTGESLLFFILRTQQTVQ